MEREVRNFHSIKSNIISFSDRPVSVSSIANGDIVISMSTGKKLRLFTKQKNKLWNALFNPGIPRSDLDFENIKVNDLKIKSPDDIYDLDHDSFSGFIANEHIDHTSVTLTAGSGLTGGGTIAADRTFNIGSGTGITVNTDSIETKDSEIDHDSLLNYIANEHIDWTNASTAFATSSTGLFNDDLTVQNDGKEIKLLNTAGNILVQIARVGTVGSNAVSGRVICKNNDVIKVQVNADGNSYFNGGDVAFGHSSPAENVHANDTVRADIAFNINGTDGFTGTGAYTNFTISGGIITAAS